MYLFASIVPPYASTRYIRIYARSPYWCIFGSSSLLTQGLVADDSLFWYKTGGGKTSYSEKFFFCCCCLSCLGRLSWVPAVVTGVELASRRSGGGGDYAGNKMSPVVFFCLNNTSLRVMLVKLVYLFVFLLRCFLLKLPSCFDDH